VDLSGLIKIQKDLQRFNRISKDSQGSIMIYKDLPGFRRIYEDLQRLRDSADKRTPHKSARLSFVEKSRKQRGCEPTGPAVTILEVHR
jgi:hypothetical protein